MPAPVATIPAQSKLRTQSVPFFATSWHWHILAACLILSSAALHLAYLTQECPLDLAPDEAHYWDWSRHLDWSYYSKGPLVAYLIRVSVEMFGSWSEQLIGSPMLAVRLPAIACGSLLLQGLYVLTLQIYGRPGLAAGVVAVALTMPIVAAGSTLMTIDAPFICCWCWALVFGFQAMSRGSKWAWPLAGLTVGLGILAKYTMILWPVSAGLFLLTDSRRRRHLFQLGFWILTAIAGGCCLPILIWNFQHDWIGIWHLTRLAGVDGASKIRWLGPFSFLGQQALLHLGFWFAVWLIAMIVHRPWKDVGWRGGARCKKASRKDAKPPRISLRLGGIARDFDLLTTQHTPRPGESPVATPTTHSSTPLIADHWPLATIHFLWWFSAPVFLVFLLFSFKTGGGEPNWPVAAYISGLVLAAGWLSTQLRSPNRSIRRWMFASLAIACGLALSVTVLMHHSTWAHPLAAQISGPPTPDRPTPLRRLDPTCRLRGWRQLAAEVDRLRVQLQAEGTEPILAAGGWSMPGELAFYCQGHPTVYSLGLALADRHSQYDLWRPNPIFDPDYFRGRTVIFVGEICPALREAFAEVDSPEVITFFDGDYPLARWTVTICRNFQGFDFQPTADLPSRY